MGVPLGDLEGSVEECNVREIIGYQIGLTAQLGRNRINRKLKPLGIAVEQLTILAFLHKYPELSQNDLGKKVGKDKTTITRMLEALVKKGLIRKEPDRNDRRVFLSYLTQEGEEVLEAALPISKEVTEEYRRLLNDDEREHLLNALEKIQQFCLKEEEES